MKKPLSPIGIVYLLFSVGMAAMMLSLVLSGGEFLEKVVYDFSYFVDFFDHIRRFYMNLGIVYEEGMHASFPPLAYLLYYLVSCVLYKENVENPDGLNQSASGMLVFCMLLVMFTVAFLCVFLNFCLLKSQGMKEWLAFMLLISYPFWLAIERGNMTLLVLLILMLAMVWMDSEKKWQRELALILFAIAAGLKLYPAIFGALYLAEKRYKEAGRLIIYGLFFFFAPFSFFHGLEGFRIFYRNISAVGSGATGVTIVGLAGRIAEKLGMSLTWGHAVGRGLSYLYFVIVLFFCFGVKRSWKTILLLTSLMIVFVAASGTYCLIYSVIPFVCFLNEIEEKKNYIVMDYIYAVLFSMVFMAYPIRALGSSGMLYISLYLLLAVVMADECIYLIRHWYRCRRKYTFGGR